MAKKNYKSLRQAGKSFISDIEKAVSQAFTAEVGEVYAMVLEDTPIDTERLFNRTTLDLNAKGTKASIVADTPYAEDANLYYDRPELQGQRKQKTAGEGGLYWKGGYIGRAKEYAENEMPKKVQFHLANGARKI